MFLPGHRSLVAHAECAGTPRVMREAQMKTPNREQLGAEFWWPGAESNRRHADFQSAALPTELPGQEIRGELPDCKEPPIIVAVLAAVKTNLTNAPPGCDLLQGQ